MGGPIHQHVGQSLITMTSPFGDQDEVQQSNE